MAIEMSSDRVYCAKCGQAFGRRKGNFPVSYQILHKGIGYIPVCKDCIDQMYNKYLVQCNDPKDAVRQMCRKLDLFWAEEIYESVLLKSTTRSMMTQYIAKLNSNKYAGKSYDDTLQLDGSMWMFSDRVDENTNSTQNNLAFGVVTTTPVTDEDEIVEDSVVEFWGSGLNCQVYRELEKKRSNWIADLEKSGYDIDITTETVVRQICLLELDISRDRAGGRATDKNVNALNNLLNKLRSSQKRNEDMDMELSSTPLGVWLYRYENERPLPDIDDDLKDVNGIKKYVFTWMGHLCKMLGIKNEYSDLYESEIIKYSVDRPEYDGDDDELVIGGETGDGGG